VSFAGWLAVRLREGGSAAFDECVDVFVHGTGTASSRAIRRKIFPRGIAVAQGIVDLLAPAREPGLEPAATPGDAGGGDSVLLRVVESGGQQRYDRRGAAQG